MQLPAGYRAIPQPFRWAVAGTIVLAALGVIYGIAESIHDYPVSSWFGVTLYVGLIGGFAGFLLGLIAGGIHRLASSLGAR